MKEDNIITKSDWHNTNAEEILKILKTTEEGLAEKEVKNRLKKYGPNALPTKKVPSFFTLFFLQFIHPIILILIAATIASLLIGEYIDALFIVIVVLLNSTLGSIQEWKAEKNAASLQSLLKVNVRVKRDGKELEIDSSRLVPGDIVLIESGNKIAADIRLININNLTVDESILTGESLPFEKSTEVLPLDIAINDKKNMCFAGTSILSGRALGVVVETGLSTEVGKIAERVILTKLTKPPLVIRMEKFTKQITFFVLLIAVILSLILFYRGYVPREIFFFVVALSVSAIPEGLPVALTVALSVATSRMLKRNVIVRKLTAVESLGSCTVIASDKTGTLTVNQQTVRKILFPDDILIDVTGEGYNDKGELKIKDSKENKRILSDIKEICEIGIMANESNLEHDGHKWKHYGDYIDVALLSLSYKAKIDPAKIRRQNKIIGEIPYESDNKFSATFYQKDNNCYVGLKGAVETVLTFCNKMKTNDGVKDINTKKIEEQAYDLAKDGYRVLGMAISPLKHFKEKDHYEVKDIPESIFVGLVAFIDPLRSESKRAVKKCHNAGIKVIMITGDHPATAASIAREINLLGEEEVITGIKLDKIRKKNEEEFDKIVLKTTVFARISPLQKLQIVESLRKQGEFVAVTGDGVNDAPALRSANIGVAMGTGTDVARETSSMIITDDNFLSIVHGVEEGRFAYDNVRKVIYLLISTGFAEVLLLILAIITGMPLPLLAAQILWLNLVTNGIQDVALAFEGGEPGAMERTPRKPTEKIFNRQMIEQTLVSGFVMTIAVFALWYYLINTNVISEEAARNYVLMLMVLMQNVHVFNCRSELTSAFKVPLKRNIILIYGVIIAFSLHVAVLYLPFMQKVLNTAPIPIYDMGRLLMLAIPLLVFLELYKYVKTRHKH